MGLCHDFGSQIGEGCGHPMRAGSDSCTCDECGVVCHGLFEGCSEVWARGPHPILLRTADAHDPDDLIPVPLRLRAVNGHETSEAHVGDSLRPAAEAGVGAAPAAGAGAGAGPGARNRTPANGPAPLRPGPRAVPDGDSQPSDGPGWVESAFAALRQQVDGLRVALAQEQALVATLVGTEKPESGPDVESLNAMIDSAVRKAVRRESVALGDTVSAVVEGVRRDMASARTATEATLAAIRESVEGVAAANAASVASLKESVEEVATASGATAALIKRSVDEIADVTSAVPAELGRREAGNRKTFRTALSQELQPLIDVVAESVAQSEFELKRITAKLDAVAAANSTLSDELAEVASVVMALADEVGVEFDESEPPPRPPPSTSRLPLSPPVATPPPPSAAIPRRPGSGADAPSPGRKVSLRGPQN